MSPAVVLRTRATTNLEVIDQWTDQPADLVVELPDEYTIDLLVHGLVGDYREYAVSMCTCLLSADPNDGGCMRHDTRSWHWPERI